jgi:hypothetical protein
MGAAVDATTVAIGLAKPACGRSPMRTTWSSSACGDGGQADIRQCTWNDAREWSKELRLFKRANRHTHVKPTREAASA